MSPTHLSIIGRAFIINGKVSFGTQSLSIVLNSEVSTIQEQKMYCVYRNSSWYIHGGPLYRGGLLFGGSVIGGSTVFSKLLFLSYMRDVYISHLAI